MPCIYSEVRQLKSKLLLLISVVVTVSLVAGLYSGVSFFQSSNSNQSPYTLTLDITTVSSSNSTLSGQYVFFVDNNGQLTTSSIIHVPFGRLVRIVIINHDSGIDPLLVPNANMISGTINNRTAVFSGTSVTQSELTSGAGSVSYTELAPGEISHTFTTSAGLNIPIAPNSTEVAYTYFNTAGTINWGCMCECGPFAMDTPGWMTGELLVTAP